MSSLGTELLQRCVKPWTMSSLDIDCQEVSTWITNNACQAQAREYIAAKTLTLTRAPVGIQIGTGVYTSPAPGEWPGGPTSWFVVVPGQT